MMRRSLMVYLAAPYSDPNPEVVEHRLTMFNYVDSKLMRQGYFTMSPLLKHYTIKTGELPSDWEYWQHYSYAMLDQSESIVVIKLAGWDTSVGVLAEIAYAKSIHCPIYYVDAAGDMDNIGGLR